jgi:hypothetical protein
LHDVLNLECTRYHLLLVFEKVFWG